MCLSLDRYNWLSFFYLLLTFYKRIKQFVDVLHTHENQYTKKLPHIFLVRNNIKTTWYLYFFVFIWLNLRAKIKICFNEIIANVCAVKWNEEISVLLITEMEYQLKSSVNRNVCSFAWFFSVSVEDSRRWERWFYKVAGVLVRNFNLNKCLSILCCYHANSISSVFFKRILFW